MLSAIAEAAEFELSEVEHAVGSQSFARGRTYARGKRVLSLAWDAGDDVLTGSVIGRGALYETRAYFAPGGGGLAFEDGECSCPIGYNCKHVAAIVVAAAAGAPTVAPGALPPARPAWEEPLRALIAAPAARTGRPLAIELAVQTGSGAARLWARLMRAGARGGWVNGSLSWGRLDSWHVAGEQLRDDHVALMRELAVLQRARGGRNGLYYGYEADKRLDLGDCGPQLWAVLDEAARLGVGVIHAAPGRGDVAPYEWGEVVLDVTAGGAGAVATPLVRADGRDREPLLFLGADGHGAVCRGEGPEGSLVLVRLERPAPARLQRLVLAREPLEIPAAELPRFGDELYPALRRVVSVASSDGSFDAPEISAPSLVFRARFGDGHTVDAGWEWAYQVGASARATPLEPDGAGFRDVDAERVILAATALGASGLDGLGLIDGSGRPAGAPVRLTGLDSLRLVTEQLPRLAALDGVGVEVEGEPADYRDVGDSVTIGVSTTELAGESDWFGLGVTIAVEDRVLPFADVFAALAGGASHMLLDDGAHFSLDDPRLQSLRQLIDEARDLTDAPASALRISRYQAGMWSELAALGVVTAQAQAWERNAAALLEVDALAEHEPPAALTADLRPYQREGFAWLASLWALGLGGILADDMGLGKTLQALALICHARERGAAEPFLVVAPTSVVPGWVSEAERFAPELSVAGVTDTLAKSGRAIGELAAADVVVTTYTLLRLEADAYRSVPWAGVILDEAQFVKNHQAKTYHCARELTAPFKLAITGTPMENNLMELWSLLSITAPGLFPDPKRFAEAYQRPIERSGDAERLARLRRRIKPLVKRRTKELVAGDLPVKQEQELTVELHPRHRKLYDKRLQRERQRILGLLDDFDRNRFTILRSITLLRQLSLHAGLVDAAADTVPCAKLNVLAEHLHDVIGGGHRALVFSQFTGFLTKVRDQLDEQRIGYCYLDGRTRDRRRVLERFKAGDDAVFLISLKAGGFGLNLTEADYCFLLDPWWNPAAEAQAVDRAHRIGQTRRVMVYRMLARDTIEEKVAALAARKAALFRGVMDEGDLFAGALTAADVRGLVA